MLRFFILLVLIIFLLLYQSNLLARYTDGFANRQRAVGKARIFGYKFVEADIVLLGKLVQGFALCYGMVDVFRFVAWRNDVLLWLLFRFLYNNIFVFLFLHRKVNLVACPDAFVTAKFWVGFVEFLLGSLEAFQQRVKRFTLLHCVNNVFPVL